MSNKEIVRDLLEKLPDEVSLLDVAQQIEFVAAVRQGLAEAERGERIPMEEIEKELPTWGEITEELRVIAAIRQGQADAAAGRVRSHAEVEQVFAFWTERWTKSLPSH